MIKNVLGINSSNDNAMQVDGEISSLIKKKKKCGVRQGYVLSTDLYYQYNEIIMQNLEGYPGTKVGEHNLNNLTFTDDTVLIAENKEDLQLQRRLIRYC